MKINPGVIFLMKRISSPQHHLDSECGLRGKAKRRSRYKEPRKRLTKKETPKCLQGRNWACMVQRVCGLRRREGEVKEMGE